MAPKVTRSAANEVSEMITRSLLLFALLAACGGGKQPDPATPGGSAAADPPGVVTDSRSEAQKRRDAGCETLGPRITKCAVDDARREYEAGKVSKQDFEANTKPEILEKNSAELVKSCKDKVPASTYHVRVLEVCQAEETECEPLQACLENLSKPPPAQP